MIEHLATSNLKGSTARKLQNNWPT